jgi:hypothetical protein
MRKARPIGSERPLIGRSAQPRPTPVVPAVEIRNVVVPTTRFAGAAAPSAMRVAPPRGRMLDRAAIRRQLPDPPTRVRWYVRITTFDLRGPKELPATRLDRRGLRAVEQALLVPAPGGSSQLGPALRATEAAVFAGRRLVVVLSDLELFDPHPLSVLHDLINTPADAVLALVFRAAPPTALAGTRVSVARIDPHTTKPAEIAQHILHLACSTLNPRPQPVPTDDVLIDILDDESGSMWSGNDALGLRHEAALIALEHLAASRPTPTRKAEPR